MILVLNCGGGGGSSPDPTNCEQCPYTSIADDLGNSCADLNASGCINMIELGSLCTPDDCAVPEGMGGGSYRHIYYNTNFNITGFQFDIENMENISSYNTYNFTIVTSEPTSIDGTRVLGYTLDGSVIPSGCGILMTILFDVEGNSNFQISNITFTDDTVNEDYSPNIIDVCPL